MNILDEIVAYKRKEVAALKERYPVKYFEESEHYQVQPVSLREYLKRPDKAGIIAEIKRRSPSRGLFHAHVSVEELSIGYMQAGASALSILTDKNFFGGSNEDVRTARRFNFCPILRKDFIVDEYQIHEAKAIGADVILLIAAVLTGEEMKAFTACAHALGLEVLLELHDREEIGKSPLDLVDVVGINNRNLKDFSVTVDTSLALRPLLPASLCVISESGIAAPETIVMLKKAGFEGFLIGETFMSQVDPAKACAKLARAVQEALS